jgi:hypothetical protein
MQYFPTLIAPNNIVFRTVSVALWAVLALLAGCGPPDGRALKRLACEQVSNSIDLQSMAQLDALRKALGVAPGVDPLETCRALGVTMEPSS